MKKIVENLKTMPESAQAEVLDYVEYLKSKEEGGVEGYEWGEFSLGSAMRGIAEEAGVSLNRIASSKLSQ